MGLLSLSNLAKKLLQKGRILWLKSEFKGQIVSKFDLGLLKMHLN